MRDKMNPSTQLYKQQVAQCGWRNTSNRRYPYIVICTAQNKSQGSISLQPKRNYDHLKGIPKPKPQTAEYKQRMSQLFRERWQNNPLLYLQITKRKIKLKEALRELRIPYEVAEIRLKQMEKKIDVWLDAYREIFGEDPVPGDVRKSNPAMYKMILECGVLYKKVERVRKYIDA
eukprot:TRINITY_DN16948_c0_g1_i8.p3 TRINITY_DN16948_c0_g1~~TRINITY_DN16948_c0_g1_i8.p3  ORF type:complete len:174 (+),score=16.39 TRINITY_DN16948_c0_g1_i8:19-540(+)